jgi:type VI secretion system protein VasJ
VNPVIGGGGGGGGGGPRVSPIESKLNEARALLAGGGALPDAVQLVMKAAAGAQTPLDRLRGKLAVAQICIQGEQFWVARAQLDGLDRMVEQHRLWEWEPALCVEFYSAFYIAQRAMNAALGGEAPPEARARENAAFERLCQLDAGAALKFTLGV